MERELPELTAAGWGANAQAANVEGVITDDCRAAVEDPTATKLPEGSQNWLPATLGQELVELNQMGSTPAPASGGNINTVNVGGSGNSGSGNTGDG